MGGVSFPLTWTFHVRGEWAPNHHDGKARWRDFLLNLMTDHEHQEKAILPGASLRRVAPQMRAGSNRIDKRAHRLLRRLVNDVVTMKSGQQSKRNNLHRPKP
mmetsp:Transcript_52038/g.71038  ORF Transcript_52038/g.71038 Transcript_52038/m.71038 type:complete len:102 (-) Transcript_52038:194-499(-)